MSNAQIMLLATAPAKIQSFLRPAHDRGLTIGLTGNQYWVSSPNPIDDHEVWLHYAAGRNGGKITATLYRPTIKAPYKTTVGITLKQAAYWIAEMADGLDRHNAREAKKAAETPAPVDPARVATLSARLNRAGRVALRLVRDSGPARGKLSHATHSKIRGAFRRLGLVDDANALTDLGRAVRAAL